MIKLISIIAICIFSLSSTAKTSDSGKTAKATSNDNLISALYGRWEGNIEYQYYENAVLNKKNTRDFRIDITPTGIEFANKNDEGEWIKVDKSFAQSLKFSTEKNTISGYFINSQADEDGIWVESQNMYITLKNAHTILLYGMRAVNNTGMSDSESGSKWMQASAGELKKQCAIVNFLQF